MLRLLRSLRTLATPRRAPRRPHSFQPFVEWLEDRRLLSTAQLQLGAATPITSFTGVGFQENQVAVLLAQVNGQPDTNKGDFQAQINWGDGQSQGDLVYMGLNGNWAEYYIKGSHTYEKATSGTPITVTVTGPGASLTQRTCTGIASPMPSGIPGTQPRPTANSSAPEDVQLQIGSETPISSYAGVGFQENEVAVLLAQVNGQPDTNLNHFSAQVNYGTDNT